MSLEPFKTIDIKTLKLADAPSSNGTAGKSVWVNRDEGLPKNFTTEKDARLLWPIRPGTSDGIVRPNERLNLEIKVSPEEEDKAREIDAMLLESLFKKKLEFFGQSKAKSISSIEALKPMYKNLLREGSIGKDGSQYANSIRMKIDGWAPYVKKVNVLDVEKNGNKIKVVKDCEWSDRLVEMSAPTERDTHFYLFVKMNPATGRAQYTDKIIVTDERGNPVIKGEKDGKLIYQMRFVGPQDALPGSSLTVAWNLSKLYISETTGPTAVAKDVYIKPVVKAQQVRAPQDVVVQEVDAEESLALLNSMRSGTEEEEPVQQPVQQPVQPVQAIQPQPAVQVHDAPQEERKRKSESSTPISKKKKTNIIEEDF